MTQILGGQVIFLQGLNALLHPPQKEMVQYVRRKISDENENINVPNVCKSSRVHFPKLLVYNTASFSFGYLVYDFISLFCYFNKFI